MRRQFFKRLKERKIFSKYCIAVEEAFSNNINKNGHYIKNPHTQCEHYIREYENLPEKDMKDYLDKIEQWTNYYHVLIQY
jgi:hypothetical protein